MAYDIAWHTTNRVLMLSVEGDYSTEDAEIVDERIKAELDRSRGNLVLVIDAQAMNCPLDFQSIRSKQSFMDHPNLRQISVVASSKLVKLAMMVIF